MSEIKTVLEIETESLVPSKELSRKTKINPCDRHHKKQTNKKTTRQSVMEPLVWVLKEVNKGARRGGIKAHLGSTLCVSQAQGIEGIVFSSDCLIKKAK